MKTENRYGLWGFTESQRILTPISIPLRNREMPDNDFEKRGFVGAMVAVELRQNELDLLDLEEDEEVDILYCYVDSDGDLLHLYHTLHHHINTYEGAKTFVMSGSRIFLHEDMQQEARYMLNEKNTLAGERTCYMGKLEDIIPKQKELFDMRAVGVVRFIYTFDLRNRWVIRDFHHTKDGKPYVMSDDNLKIIEEREKRKLKRKRTKYGNKF